MAYGKHHRPGKNFQNTISNTQHKFRQTSAIFGNVALIGVGSLNMHTTELFRTFQDVIVLKNLQCIAVCTVDDCSESKSVMPLTHRIGRLQNHHISSTN